MFGTSDPAKLAERVPTKKVQLVAHKLRQLRQQNRKEAESKSMTVLPFVDLNSMDDLFMAGGTRPKEVLNKWMDYLKNFYQDDPYQYDKFKLFSNAFLIMSECTPKTMAVENDDEVIDFKWVFCVRIVDEQFAGKIDVVLVYVTLRHRVKNESIYTRNAQLKIEKFAFKKIAKIREFIFHFFFGWLVATNTYFFQ